MQPNNLQNPYGAMHPQKIKVPGRKPWGWIASVVALSLTLVLVSSLFFWAFKERSKYKNDSDLLVASAQEATRQEVVTEKEKEFLEREKTPFREYRGPEEFGAVSLFYPRTWSAYVKEDSSAAVPVDGLFHPNFVPAEGSEFSYALHLEITDRDLPDELATYDSAVKSGDVKVTPISVKKVPNVNGSRIDGEIETGKKGSRVLLPLRDKTLIITCESEAYLTDFNNTILDQISFNP